MGVRMQCVNICARTRAPQTLSGSWATQNRQFMTTKNAYRAIIDVAKGIGELSPARKQHKQCRDSLDETDRDLGRFMLRLAANMGVQKSTIIDVMSSLGWKRWPRQGAPLIFQQDGAPTYNTKVTQTWLSQNLFNFWGKGGVAPKQPRMLPLGLLHAGSL